MNSTTSFLGISTNIPWNVWDVTNVSHLLLLELVIHYWTLLLQCYITGISFGHMMLTGKLLQNPFLFCHINWSYEASKTSIKNLLDTTDDVLHYPYFCSNKRFGKYNLSEAVKVDLSIQCSMQTKEQNYERYVSNSMTLVKVLFEELYPAIDYIKDLGHQTMKAELDQHFMLFNYEKKGPMKDTHLISRLELTLNYPPNKMNHSKFLNHGVFSFVG